MKIFFSLLLTAFYLLSPPHTAAWEKVEKGMHQPNPITTNGKDSLTFLPQGTIIHKRTDDKIFCFLPRNTEIQGILCRGDSHRGWETAFYRNGKLALAWLARTEEIQGVPCMKASFWTEIFGGGAAVHFHDNGRLAKCKLARDAIIQGHTFKKGDHVSFDREGKLILKK